MLSHSVRGVITLLFLLVAVGSAAADKGETIALWPKQVPGEKGDIGEEREEPARPGDNTIRLANVTQPTITLYRPFADKDTGAAVLICPGGGYSILAYNKEGTEVAEWLNRIGVTGIVLKYRVPVRKGLPRHQPPLQDAQRALGLVRHRAKKLGLDPERIGVLGFSAGGHLAAVLSNNYAKRAYDPIDDADKVSCRPNFALLIYPAYLATLDEVTTTDNLVPELLPVTDKTPRTFLAMTQDDGVRVENSLTYFLALKRANVPSELHVYPSGGHGYGLRPSKHSVSSWPRRAEEWLWTLRIFETRK